jgi:two-component system phosphate regulon response regulator PhoB
MEASRILVGDDTPDILEMLKFILEGEGYGVLTAATGQEVLASIRRDRPDLVLLDLRMPGLDGFGVLRELNRGEEEPPPVVVLSAKGTEEDRRAAIAAGARSYLFKPFTVSQLLHAVREQLNGSR